jgi:hypothetical protein
MVWIHLIILLALLQLLFFIILVGKARGKFNVVAPAITGHVDFERYYRVQMNTIELLVIFIPSIILASIYWSPYLMAILGLFYLIGRLLFLKAYIGGKNRTVPFLMGLIPILLFVILGILGTLRALIKV